MDDDEKKERIVEIICDCLHLWEKELPFDIQKIYMACQKVKELEYINRRNWKKPIKSSKYIAQFEIDHNVKSADIYVSVYDYNRNLIKRKLLVASQPDEWSFVTI